MRRAKSLEWILLIAVLAVPAFLFARWQFEIKNSAAPSTRPTAIVTAKVEAPAIEASREPVVAARPEGPSKPPKPEAPPVALSSEPVLLAMRDPMLSPYDRIAMIRPDVLPEAPRAPPPSPPRLDAGIHLEGVILTGDQPPRAIVNGSVLGEGDTVKGAKILRIGANGVVFGKGRERFTKRLSD